MRATTKYAGVAVLLLSGVLLAGCLSGGARKDVSIAEPDLTLEEAKKTTMAMELELAAMVPADIVTSIDQHPTGVLLSCQGDRVYQWAGQTNVVVSSPPDSGAIVDAIVARYLKTEEYTASRDQRIDNQPRAQVLGAYGADYLIGPSGDNTAIGISSFSPCFVLPEGMSSDGSY